MCATPLPAARAKVLELPLCAEVLELAHCISRIFRRIIPAEGLDVAHNAEVLDVAHDAEVLDVPHSAEVLALPLSKVLYVANCAKMIFSPK